MLLTLTLGGLGMFLLVLAFSFLAAQIVVKNREMFDREECLVECDDCEFDEEIDALEGIETDKDIFIIQTENEKTNQARLGNKASVSWMERNRIKDQISKKMVGILPKKMTGRS